MSLRASIESPLNLIDVREFSPLPSKIKILNLNWRQCLVMIVGVCLCLPVYEYALELSRTPIEVSGGPFPVTLAYGSGLGFCTYVGCIILTFTSAGVFFLRSRQNEWYETSSLGTLIKLVVIGSVLLAALLFGILSSMEVGNRPFWMFIVAVWACLVTIAVPMAIWFDAAFGRAEKFWRDSQVVISLILLLPCLMMTGLLLGATVMPVVKQVKFLLEGSI